MLKGSFYILSCEIYVYINVLFIYLSIFLAHQTHSAYEGEKIDGYEKTSFNITGIESWQKKLPFFIRTLEQNM